MNKWIPYQCYKDRQMFKRNLLTTALFRLHQLLQLLVLRCLQHQHLANLLSHDCSWSILVASLDLCLDRLRSHWFLRSWKRSIWCRISHWIPRYSQIKFWYYRCFLAGFQPCCNGLCLVCCPGMAWWRMHCVSIRAFSCLCWECDDDLLTCDDACCFILIGEENKRVLQTN